MKNGSPADIGLSGAELCQAIARLLLSNAGSDEPEIQDPLGETPVTIVLDPKPVKAELVNEEKSEDRLNTVAVGDPATSSLPTATISPEGSIPMSTKDVPCPALKTET